jgi:hypothetical protein
VKQPSSEVDVKTIMATWDHVSQKTPVVHLKESTLVYAQLKGFMKKFVALICHAEV